MTRQKLRLATQVLLLAVLVLPANLRAQAAPEPAAPFPFLLPWNDASSNAVDMSRLNPAPIGEAQRVHRQGAHFVDATGRRLRFFGTNFTFGTNFMSRTQAQAVAARLHKFGFNLVRLHHMDTLHSPNGVLAPGPGTRTLDAGQLDHLDYLISQLKAHGIYVDLNLLVGRRFSVEDGAAGTGEVPRAATFFDAHLIDLQKEYARALLGHLNPYTGMRYADDPDIALVEINNEASLANAGTPVAAVAWEPAYREELNQKWTAFLLAKYTDRASIGRAWAKGRPNLLAADFPWRLESPPNQATLEMPAPENAPVPGPLWQISAPGPVATIPPVQLVSPPLSLWDGTSYRFTFWARASVPGRQVNVNARLNQPPWSDVGLVSSVALTADWKQYSLDFAAHDPGDPLARVAFTLEAGEPPSFG